MRPPTNNLSAHRKCSELPYFLKLGRIHGLLQMPAFQTSYHPITHLTANRIVGFEALTSVRVRPYRSYLEWFQEANEVGLGVEIELTTFASAIKGLDRLPPGMFLALNISTETLVDKRAASLLASFDVRRLVLELTEHTQVKNYGLIQDVLCPLRRQGLRLAIDDVGAGYASMQHVLHLRPDLIKIDIGLTRNIDVCAGRAALVAGLVRFAETFGADVVAMGVETKPQLQRLRELSINYAQGFLLAQPTASIDAPRSA